MYMGNTEREWNAGVQVHREEYIVIYCRVKGLIFAIGCKASYVQAIEVG